MSIVYGPSSMVHRLGTLSCKEVAVRPYNQGGDFPTLLALIVAVGFPVLLLSLVFDFFPRDQIGRLLAETQVPWLQTAARPSPSPVAVQSPVPTAPVVTLRQSDWEIPGGRFYTQTNNEPRLTRATGFAVTNAAGLAFWDELKRLGSVEAVGYPLSNRFTWRGFTVQVFQKLVFMASEASPEVQIVNVFDELHNLGKDDWLANERFTPRQLDPEFDRDLAPADIPAARLALLADDPVIEAAYRGAADPVRQFGLPTSKVTDMGDYLVAIRCQRAVLQRWKRDMRWAKAGEVTVANGGQIAIEADLFPADALNPVEMAPPAQVAVVPSPSPGAR